MSDNNDRFGLNRRRLLGALGGGAAAIAGLGVLSSPVLAWDRDDVAFRGCSEVWITVAAVDITFDPPAVADVIVQTAADTLECRRQFFTPETTTTIPGQFGDDPVLKYEIADGEKILGVIVYNYKKSNGGINPNIEHPLFVNPNNCASTPDALDPEDAPCAVNYYVAGGEKTPDGTGHNDDSRPSNGGSGGPPNGRGNSR